MSKLIRIVAAASLIAAVFVFIVPNPASALSFTVNTTDDLNDGTCDAGHCSLREAIIAAEANAGPDTIDFNISGCGGVCTIMPSGSNLPTLANGSTMIDGYSQLGASSASGGTPALIMIELDGSHASTTIGLQISSSGNEIKGLAINRFGTGILISGSGANSNTIEGSHIGTDPTGLVALGNSDDGILISLTANTNTIGGDQAGERNVVSGNGRDGIRLQDFTTQDNVVIGNYIGIDAYGTGDLGNSGNGITVWNSASANTIGGVVSGEGNVISGNTVDGIFLNGSGVSGIYIVNNIIGLAKNGVDQVPNGQNGIQVINGASSNTVGGSISGVGNVISFNGASGVSISGTTTQLNTLAGNLIGTDVSGTIDRGNNSEGVRISSGAHDNTIGGDSPQERNLISGNNQGGVRILSTGSTDNIISGNYIGTDINGTSALGNTSDGVALLSGARFNTVGGDTAAEGNLISGNSMNGVSLFGSATISNHIRGNFIGTDSSGSLAIPNMYGVSFDDTSHDNVLGGFLVGEGNVISGNSQEGVRIRGNAVSNSIDGNFIGVNSSGTSALSNGSDGVLITSGAGYNSIGSGGSAPGNVISGNGGNGIAIKDLDTHHNTVAGNLIGLDATGMSPIANAQNGIVLGLGTHENTIGGNSTGFRNVISGNTYAGIELQGVGTNLNEVRGNYIGLGTDGSTPFGNAATGVSLATGPQNNTIGSTLFAARNVVSGNLGNGIMMNGSGVANNTIIGNFVGTDAVGGASRENGGVGIGIAAGASDNDVGGDLPGEGNLISGNHFSGVLITGVGTSGNTVNGNRIGTDHGSVADLGNGSSGVYISSGASGNTIGGSSAGDRNLIAGNDSYGVAIFGIGTNGNTIAGSYIGTNATGGTALPNDANGVHIANGAQGNTVGGSTPGTGNLISGNSGIGVNIDGSGTDNNYIEGNIIGLNAVGTADLGNGFNGVQISSGASSNTIGGDSITKRNIVSGNASHGVAMYDPTTSGNLVKGNFIGTDITGTIDLGNDSRGVDIGSGAYSNTIGGDTPDERNVISGNYIGIFITGPNTDNNVIKGNYIGTDVTGVLPLANDSFGVDIYNGAQDNMVGPRNIVAFNGTVGVRVDGGSTFGNEISQNSIHDNTLLGIGLGSGANGGISAPTITSVVLGPPITISGTTCNNCTVEAFSNPGTDGEGWHYLGSTVANSSGDFSLNVGAISEIYLTATATDAADGTSEFPSTFTSAIRSLFLPLIMR